MIASLNNPHAHITRPPSLTKSWGFSFGGHVLLLVFLSITAAYSIRTAPPTAIQVRIVGVPQPNAAPKPVEKPQEVRTQDSAAPYEAPKVIKNLPEQTATNKFTVKPETKVEKLPPNPIEAKKRPPVLDKTPREKKVVKNDLNAKVVNNPEDFLKALSYIDKIKAAPSATTAVADVKEAPAGEGPQIQLNLSDQGEADAIRRHIEQFWLKPPGVMTDKLETTFLVDVDTSGNLTNVRLTSSSGNPAYDATIERAIRRAQPLPIPQGKYDKFKQLELHFAG
ncbi:MAG TPA: TonB family protein [Alphaproteobacteria bacterium]|nr:TonB family protein [Alphaproteobacteria bacterium]